MHQHRIDEAHDRLAKLVEDPPFGFEDTPGDEAESYLRAYRSFKGWDDGQIGLAEHLLGLSFPAAYRHYLTSLGTARGPLFEGEDIPGPEQYLEFRETANVLLRESGVPPLLSTDVVFEIHQGYQFGYFRADGGEDPVVWWFTEGETACTETNVSFSEFVLNEVAELESAWSHLRSSGGYRVVIRNGEVVRSIFGGQGSTRQDKKWWEFWKS